METAGIWKDPRTRVLSVMSLSLITVGTVFYHNVEGWRWLDSAYFSVILLTTVGLGDLSPKTDFGKIFTMFYLLAGIGVLVALFQSIVLRATDRRLARRVHEPMSDAADGTEEVS